MRLWVLCNVLTAVRGWWLKKDFAAIPDQGISADMEMDDESQRVLQETQKKLQQIAAHIADTDQYLKALNVSLNGNEMRPEQKVMEEHVKQKQAELYQARVALETTVGKIQQKMMVRRREARQRLLQAEASRRRKTARRASAVALRAANQGASGSDFRGSGKVFDREEHQMIDSIGEPGGFVDDSDDDDLLSSGDDCDLFGDESDEIAAPDEPFNPKIAAKLREGILKYLGRRPMPMAQLRKKLKPALNLATTPAQQKLAQQFLVNTLDEIGFVVVDEKRL